MFNQKQIQEIIEILDDTHYMFIAKYINPSLVSDKQMKRLIKLGFTQSQVIQYPRLAFQFGLLSHYLKDSYVRSLTFHQLKQNVKAKKYMPLSKVELKAVEFLERRAMNDIKGLGNKVSQNLQTIFIEADSKQRADYEKIIKNAAKKAIKRRESAQYVVSEIGRKTGDWSRDLARISDYILQESYNHGRASALEKTRGLKSLIYYDVHQNACKHCKRIYLKSEKTWEPRVFTLKEVMDNGSNIGKKVNDWKASLSPIHPWCQCNLMELPNGYIYDEKTKTFIPDVKKKRKRDFTSQIKIKKND